MAITLFWYPPEYTSHADMIMYYIKILWRHHKIHLNLLSGGGSILVILEIAILKLKW